MIRISLTITALLDCFRPFHYSCFKFESENFVHSFLINLPSK